MKPRSIAKQPIASAKDARKMRRAFFQAVSKMNENGGLHENPDGKYLIKGGGRKVWKRFRLRKEHRRSQGIIHGKRCGTTQNIGRAARWSKSESWGAYS